VPVRLERKEMATSEVALMLGVPKGAQYTLHLRLNPQMLAALRDAQRHGDHPTIQLGTPPEPSVSACLIAGCFRQFMRMQQSTL